MLLNGMVCIAGLSNLLLLLTRERANPHEKRIRELKYLLINATFCRKQRENKGLRDAR